VELNIKYFRYCFTLTHTHVVAKHTETKIDFTRSVLTHILKKTVVQGDE